MSLSQLASMGLAVLINVAVSLALFLFGEEVLPVSIMRSFGTAVWLVPVLLHWVVFRRLVVWQKLLVSVVGLPLTYIGALAMALAVYGDAP